MGAGDDGTEGDDEDILELVQAAMGPGTLCAVFVETDDKTGLAHRVSPVRVAGRLEPVVPNA